MRSSTLASTATTLDAARFRFVAIRFTEAKQPTWRRMRAFSILECNLAVHNDETITLGAPDTPPFTGRQVVQDFNRPGCECVELVHNKIGRHAFTLEHAVPKPCVP